MSQREDRQFLELYRKHRYEDQLDFYRKRYGEFTKAQAQGIFISIGLMFFVFLAGALESVDVPWLKLTCLLAAAICPVLSTAFAAYSALYAFEQQTKLYRDTINNLQGARVLLADLEQGLSDADFATHLDKYVQEVEKIFQAEQGQWGQLAKKMKPSET
ncbi:MAG TPA: SLATT domain-containing protein [Ktedonobacteraceae bacterium]|nr:SLATT domain-containing protein [Ktedonobacteraceae bacterium]